MNKLKVGVYISNDFIPEHGGGYSYYTQIIQNINKFKFDKNIEFVFFSIDLEVNQIFEKEYIKITTITKKTSVEKFYIFLNRRYLKILLKIFLLFKIVKKPKTDFKTSVQTALRNNDIDIIYYPIPLNLELDYPFIYTHWDNGHKTMFAFPEVTMQGIFEKREKSVELSLFKAFAVFCESETGKKEAIELYRLFPDKIYIIPLPPGRVATLNINLEEQKIILQKYQLLKNEFFFYPAQFWAHKNHYNLILAFKEFTLEYPNLKLVLTGSDQGNFNYIKKCVDELQLKKNILFAGFVDENIIYTLYKNCISLVMPTFLGPTNMPILEAQNLGCKIICSDLPGHKEMLKDGAIYINPKNKYSILNAMKAHYQDKTKPQELENAFFNLKNSTEHLEKAFLDLFSIVKTFGRESF